MTMKRLLVSSAAAGLALAMFAAPAMSAPIDDGTIGTENSCKLNIVVSNTAACAPDMLANPAGEFELAAVSGMGEVLNFGAGDIRGEDTWSTNPDWRAFRLQAVVAVNDFEVPLLGEDIDDGLYSGLKSVHPAKKLLASPIDIANVQALKSCSATATADIAMTMAGSLDILAGTCMLGTSTDGADLSKHAT